MMPCDLDGVRRSTSATLSEIVDREAALRLAGLDVRDEDEWMQLRDIVARIERRLKAMRATE
jgi:hypothetical protein